MVNTDQPPFNKWKTDIRASQDLYNKWFMDFAPTSFKKNRINATQLVEKVFADTEYLRNISPDDLRKNPEILPILRMSTCPPIAVDRLIGLAKVSDTIVDSMENKKVVARGTTDNDLASVIDIIDKLLDHDIFPWLKTAAIPEEKDAYRAATIVADRHSGALTNPMIRNRQEARQLEQVEEWLTKRGYQRMLVPKKGLELKDVPPGYFLYRMSVKGIQSDGKIKRVPVDAIIMPLTASKGDLPLLVEAKSAGDFANTNKRWKEEVTKFSVLKRAYGDDIKFVLFLSGFFGITYLASSASEGIDWVWEHRIEDFAKMNL